MINPLATGVACLLLLASPAEKTKTSTAKQVGDGKPSAAAEEAANRPARPPGLLVTKRTEEQFNKIGVSDKQRRLLEELALAHRRAVAKLRGKAGIDKPMIRARDKSIGKARSLGLKGDAVWKHLQQQLGLSDAQRDAFKETKERHEKFRKEALALLTEEQRASLKKLPKRKRKKKEDRPAAKQPESAPKRVEEPTAP